MLHISQIEKPRCSARIDQTRLRRAIHFPLDSQKAVSSGFQSEIQVVFGVLIALAPYQAAVLLPIGEVPHGSLAKPVPTLRA
jgi:hypothetical protein